METHKLIMGVGIVVIILGALLMMRITIYYDNTMRTIVEFAIKLAILGLGYAIYNKGTQMRDGR